MAVDNTERAQSLVALGVLSAQFRTEHARVADFLDAAAAALRADPSFTDGSFAGMDYAAILHLMYLAHCEACALAGIAPPTPDGWANLIPIAQRKGMMAVKNAQSIARTKLSLAAKSVILGAGCPTLYSCSVLHRPTTIALVIQIRCPTDTAPT